MRGDIILDSDLATIVYCSISEIKGTDAEIADGVHDILCKARSNNTGVGITGALLYSGGQFAQVLEGPRPALDRVLQTTRGDVRHSHLAMAFESAATDREFPAWSMAFGDGRNHPEVTAAIDAAFAASPHAGEEMLWVLKSLIVREDWLL